MHLDHGVDHQQRSIAIVTLHVQVVQVGRTVDVWLQVVLVLIALPGPETEIPRVEHQSSELAEVELCPCLDAESAAHVVVALNHVEVVALGTTQQDATHEHTLFHL